MTAPLIAVVGTTGVGKTSLVRALRAAGAFQVGLEQHTGRPFQALFKTDSRYALANQFDYLLLRAEQERELRRAAEPGLIDGGLDQDFHGFTRLFHARGYLEDPEFDLCQRLYETIRAGQPAPDLVIALNASPEITRRRLEARQRINIAGPQDISLLQSYLQRWLTSLDPQQVLTLDVSTASPDYTELIPGLLNQIRARLNLYEAGNYDTSYIP